MALHDRDVEIRRPCPVKLSPDRARDGARSWYCGHCEKSVHVLSNMTETEARGFLEERAGTDLCVTYAVRRDGSIRFKPEPPPEAIVPLSALTRRRAIAAVGLGMALAACSPHEHPKVHKAQIEVNDEPGSLPTPPIVPDAPVEPDPDEMLVDGELTVEPMVRGELPPEPLPIRAGGIRAAPLPPDTTTAEEPCDTQKSAPVRGRIRPKANR